MARTGRPPKPTEEKRRTGNPGGRPLAVATNLAVVPAAEIGPTELDPMVTLDSVFAAASHWLAVTDTTALAVLRESLEERQGLRSAVLAGHGDRKELRDLDKQIIAQLSALGFDPTARGRLGLVEVKAASTLDRLKRDRASS